MRLGLFTDHRFLVALLVWLAPFVSEGQRLAVPEHGGRWVHDEAGILSASTIAELEQMLKAERDSTSNQIAVLIVRSLNGESIDEYALRVAHNEWKLGQANKDNGVLLLVAIEDREIRIEVGQGLEGVLTDALSSRINRNEIKPRFQQGDFDGGIKVGVAAIIQAIKGEYKNDDPPRKKSRRNSPFTTIIIIIVVLIALARKRGGRGGGGYWSSGGGWIGPMGGGGFGSSSGSWGSGSDFGGGGGFSGGGSSDSW